MRSVEHHSCGDPDAMFAAVARWIDRAIAGSDARYVALAVGDSTLPAFRHLGPLPPGKAVICLDELLPPPAQAERTFAARLAQVLAPTWREALQPFTGLFAEPGHVEAKLAAGGLAVAVCGLGPDGHIAFNQPPDDGTSATRLVDLTPANLRRLGDVAPARGAITLGLATIRSAEYLAVVVAGSGKADALRRLLRGPDGPDCPATALRDHPSLAVFSSEG